MKSKRLNGMKYLIVGNHDSEKCIKSKHWASVNNMFELKLTNHPSLDTKRQLIVLNHYAMRTWNKSHHGSWHLFGHSHNTLLPHGQSFDVGVDCWDYTPISVEQVKDKMATLKQDNILKVFIVEGVLNCEEPIQKDIISKSESVYVKVRKNFSDTNIIATMYCYAKDSAEAESKFETTVSEYIHNLSTVEEITEICETTRTIFNSVV